MNHLYCISWAANRWCGAFGAVRWRSRGPSGSHWVIRGQMLHPRLLQRKCERVSARVGLQTEMEGSGFHSYCVFLPLCDQTFIHESWRPHRWTWTYWRRKAGDKSLNTVCATNKSVVLSAPFNIINPGRIPSTEWSRLTSTKSLQIWISFYCYISSFHFHFSLFHFIGGVDY